jgi:phosphatidylinositol-bisphosphatase
VLLTFTFSICRNIFWFGDFNYRLNDMSKEEVQKFVEEEKYKELWANGFSFSLFLFLAFLLSSSFSPSYLILFLHSADQMRIEMEAERIFVGFKELPLRFAPTYKYDPFRAVYDSGPKNRAPAWCDQILWRSENVLPLEYRR